MDKIACEACGSTDLLKQGEYLVCQYCGVKHSLSGSNPPVSPLPGKDRFFTRALIHLNHGEYEEAKLFFLKHLDDYPEDGRGWWGCVRAKTRDLSSLPCGGSDIISDYQKAKQFSPEADRAEIMRQMKSMTDEGKAFQQQRIIDCQTRLVNTCSLLEQAERDQKTSDKLNRQLAEEREHLDNETKLVVPRFPKVLLIIAILGTLFVIGLFRDYEPDQSSWISLIVDLIVVAIFITCLANRSNVKKRIDNAKAQLLKFSDRYQPIQDMNAYARVIQSRQEKVALENTLVQLRNELEWYQSLQL